MNLVHIGQLGVIVVWTCLLQQASCQEATDYYSGCDTTEYYANLSTDRSDWTREALEALVSDQRNVLPYTSSSGGEDVWEALADLDKGTEADTVRLIYSQRDIPASPRGTSSTWNREHLYPKSRGVRYNGADFTDVHHLRPADWNVNSARSNLYFGDCSNSHCTVPATDEAASDTAKDSSIFTPPASVRGDIARAMFYMDVRYSAENNNGDDLVLTDCPRNNLDDQTSSNRDMAYLSVLLEWHAADPVSDEETSRNNRVCERWQGNRNPFVDFPDLVPQFFGVPQSSPYDCSDMQDGSTYAPGDDSIVLRPGDVMVVALHADNPDVVALVALADLPQGTKIYITDNAWTGSSFLDNEGTLSLTLGSRLPSGTVFGYGDGMQFGNSWKSADNGFSLTASGEQILVHTYDGDDLVHLSGISFSGDWEDGTDLDSASSALPESIEDFAVTVPHFDNVIYRGPTQGKRNDLLSFIVDPNNWEGSNTDNSLANSLLNEFNVTSAGRSTRLDALVSTFFGLLLLG